MFFIVNQGLLQKKQGSKERQKIIKNLYTFLKIKGITLVISSEYH